MNSYSQNPKIFNFINRAEEHNDLLYHQIQFSSNDDDDDNNNVKTDGIMTEEALKTKAIEGWH